MGFDSKNQSRCKSSLIKRDQKVPKVMHADQCPAQPARASVSPLFKGGGCETGRRLSDLCFRKGVADAAVDPPEILPEPFPPAVHCLGGRTIRGERIFLRCHSVQGVLDGCIYIVLVRGEILWKLSVEPVTVSAPEAADHAVIKSFRLLRGRSCAVGHDTSAVRRRAGSNSFYLLPQPGEHHLPD